MNRATTGLLAVLLIGTAACVQGTNVDQVKAGMSPEQVASIMGPADGTTNEPGRRCDFYTVLKDFWSRVPWSVSDRYYICYADGKVDTFGRATPDAPDAPRKT